MKKIGLPPLPELLFAGRSGSGGWAWRWCCKAGPGTSSGWWARRRTGCVLPWGPPRHPKSTGSTASSQKPSFHTGNGARAAAQAGRSSSSSWIRSFHLDISRPCLRFLPAGRVFVFNILSSVQEMCLRQMSKKFSLFFFFPPLSPLWHELNIKISTTFPHHGPHGDTAALQGLPSFPG